MMRMALHSCVECDGKSLAIAIFQGQEGHPIAVWLAMEGGVLPDHLHVVSPWATILGCVRLCGGVVRYRCNIVTLLFVSFPGRTTKTLTRQIALAYVDETSCHFVHVFCLGSILIPFGCVCNSYSGVASNNRGSGVGEVRGVKRTVEDL